VAGEGSVFRRCGCMDPPTGRQYGSRCPRLGAGGRHGSWYVRLELPGGLDGRRRRTRRGGYPSRKAALEVLARLRNPKAGGTGGIITVGDWLAHWLVSRTSPAASTVRRYAAHVRWYRSVPADTGLRTRCAGTQISCGNAGLTRAMGHPSNIESTWFRPIPELVHHGRSSSLCGRCRAC
jgi:hypothetical protein